MSGGASTDLYDEIVFCVLYSKDYLELASIQTIHLKIETGPFFSHYRSVGRHHIRQLSCISQCM